MQSAKQSWEYQFNTDTCGEMYRSQLHKAIWFVCGSCQRSINILLPLSHFSAGSDVQDGVCQMLAAENMPPRKLGV